MEVRPILLSLKHYKVFSLIIIVQVALTLTAVTHSSLSTYSLIRDWSVPSGLTEDNQMWVWPQSYDVNVEIDPIIDQDMETIRNLPGVLHVTPTNLVPFTQKQVSNIYRETGEEAQTYATIIFEMNSSALDALGVNLLAGRSFTESEVLRGERSQLMSYPSVALISEQQGEAMFGEDNPVGQTIWLSKDNRPVEVIGVYSNFMMGEPLNTRGMPYRSVIVPLVAWTERANPQYLVRTEPGAVPGLLEDIRRALYETPGRYLIRIEGLNLARKRLYDGRGSEAIIMMVVSAVLVLISCLGMAGLVSFLVTQRVKQIGVRRALGARKKDILRYLLSENSIVTWIGLLLGTVVVLVITYQQLADSGEHFLRPGYLLVIALLLWLVNLVAVYIPARRASNIDPAIVTR